jgi:hypothetical protein
MNHAQYDHRCPLCRAVPEGVSQRVEEEVHPGEGFNEELQIFMEEVQRESKRYYARRQRLIRSHPTLKTMSMRQKGLRTRIAREEQDIERTYSAKCKHVWKTDESLVRKRKTKALLRRQELRLEQKLKESVAQALGPPPLMSIEWEEIPL